MELLLKNHIEFGAKFIDKAYEFDNVVAEAADGPVAKFSLVQTSKFLSPKIEDDIKKEVHDVMDSIILGLEDNTLDEAEKEKIASELLDIPELIISKSKLSEGVKGIIKGLFYTLDGIIKEVIK